jgi:hypothetical protein
MDDWTPEQIMCLRRGGNEQLRQCFVRSGVPESLSMADNYNSNVAECYRAYIRREEDMRDSLREELGEIPRYKPTCRCENVLHTEIRVQAAETTSEYSNVIRSSILCLYYLGMMSPKKKADKRPICTSPRQELQRRQSFRKIDHYAASEEQHERNNRVPLVSDSESDSEWVCPSPRHRRGLSVAAA